MKKAYISPLAEVVKTETEQMICQSIDFPISDQEFNSDLTITDNVGSFDNVFEGLW